MTITDKPSAAALIEMIETHRNELTERRDVLADELDVIDKELALLDAAEETAK